MQIKNEWFADMPQQFLEKKNIKILILAFSRQMDELIKAFDDINLKTTIDHAKGVNLDYVGSILNLSRKDANIILRKLDVEQLDDELYRQVIRYKAMKNTCCCTYEDIVGSMKLLWNADDVSYIEPEEKPATICMRIAAADIDIKDPAAARILAIKPAGVHLYYDVGYYTVIDESSVEKIDVPDMRINWKIPFWGVRLFNGSWNMNGSNLLDARGTYRLDVCAENHFVMKDESADAQETFEISVTTHRKSWCFDGSFLLDGTNKLDAKWIMEVL